MSDPSIDKMTQAQWLFEALALSKKEKAQREFALELFKHGAEGLRTMLIRLLGLDIGVESVDDAGHKEGTPGTPLPFVPLTLYTGRPDFLKSMMERQEKIHETDMLQNSKRAAEIEVLNEDLMNLDIGDLEPLLSGRNSADPFERWNSPEMQQMLADLGIVVHDGDPNRDIANRDEGATKDASEHPDLASTH